ncbi:MAG: hypothetical protein EOO22_20555 [Comamonadaceae bacterium]|nr:MAG: hypothetical protein EOO22_20555 [Comamonadaceae bacterium]
MYKIPAGEMIKDLPRTDVFISATGHVAKSRFGLIGKVKAKANGMKSRGRIELIDAALTHWHASKQGAFQNVELALFGVVKECQEWLELKKASMKASSGARRTQVQELQGLAYSNLIELRKHRAAERARLLRIDANSAHNLHLMNLRKAQGGHWGNVPLKAMSGAYQNERDFYVNSGKTSTASASMMHEHMEARSMSNFDALDPAAYSQLAAQFQAQGLQLDMVYLNKRARSEYFVLVDEDGLCYEADGNLIDSNYDEPWAMDKYGNFFYMRLKGGVQINHSSFLAGKEVICAGVMKIKAGKLVYLDNNSGHYKPTVQNLANAIDVLNFEHHADLEDTIVGVKVAGADMPKFYRVEDLARLGGDVDRFMTLPEQPPPP